MNAADSSWRTRMKVILSWRFRSASIIPLIPSPGRPKMTRTPQSMRRSANTSDVVRAMGFSVPPRCKHDASEARLLHFSSFIWSLAMDRPFANRREAGVELASKLRQYAGRDDVVVLALPRGGVPVAFEVAEALDAPLDIFLVRKLGLPGHPELAMGAIASGGVRILNDEVVQWYSIPDRAIEAVARTEKAELERREQEYRQGRPLIDLRGNTVILVDDGLATGSTM